MEAAFDEFVNSEHWRCGEVQIRKCFHPLLLRCRDIPYWYRCIAKNNLLNFEEFLSACQELNISTDFAIITFSAYNDIPEDFLFNSDIEFVKCLRNSWMTSEKAEKFYTKKGCPRELGFLDAKGTPEINDFILAHKDLFKTSFFANYGHLNSKLMEAFGLNIFLLPGGAHQIVKLEPEYVLQQYNSLPDPDFENPIYSQPDKRTFWNNLMGKYAAKAHYPLEFYYENAAYGPECLKDPSYVQDPYYPDDLFPLRTFRAFKFKVSCFDDFLNMKGCKLRSITDYACSYGVNDDEFFRNLPQEYFDNYSYEIYCPGNSKEINGVFVERLVLRKGEPPDFEVSFETLISKVSPEAKEAITKIYMDYVSKSKNNRQSMPSQIDDETILKYGENTGVWFFKVC